MTKIILINDCRECPHRHYGDVCYKDNTRIYLYADEKFPDWCPLTEDGSISTKKHYEEEDD